jgi:uncharacterized membrane protein YGL010W
MSTTKRDGLIRHYAASHRDPRNEAIHCVCVPAIVFAVIGFLFYVNIGLTLMAIAAAVIYYSRFSPLAAVEMAVILILMMAAWLMLMPTHHILLAAAAIFILAWIGQFIGHAYEGAKPSFFEDVQYFMIGPLFILAVLKNRVLGSSTLPTL